VFNSAPIIKRYDEVSLETVDGIYVLIRGFINKQCTLDNGFTPQVCIHKCQCFWWLVLQDIVDNGVSLLPLMDFCFFLLFHG
jgi:hypothetical protein